MRKPCEHTMAGFLEATFGGRSRNGMPSLARSHLSYRAQLSAAHAARHNSAHRNSVLLPNLVVVWRESNKNKDSSADDFTTERKTLSLKPTSSNI